MKFDAADITFVDASRVKKQIDAALDAGDAVLDFTGVEHVDSTMVALVLHAQRRAAQLGLTLVLRNEPAGFRELTDVYGLDEVIVSAAGNADNNG